MSCSEEGMEEEEEKEDEEEEEEDEKERSRSGLSPGRKRRAGQRDGHIRLSISAARRQLKMAARDSTRRPLPSQSLILHINNYPITFYSNTYIHDCRELIQTTSGSAC